MTGCRCLSCGSVRILDQCQDLSEVLGLGEEFGHQFSEWTTVKYSGHSLYQHVVGDIDISSYVLLAQAE